MWNDKEPRDAELVNIGMTLLRKSLDYIQPADVFKYLLPQLAQVSDDGTQAIKWELFRLTNSDWIMRDGEGGTILPQSWLKLLNRHTKMLMVLIELSARTDNNGVLKKANTKAIARRLDMSEGSVQAYILRLASMGFITLLDPEIDGKLYLNCQLHGAPVGKQPTIAAEALPSSRCVA